MAAGEWAADFFTLVSSAVRKDLEVWAYVKGVLDRFLAGSADNEVLRPDRLREAPPSSSIRQYRFAECRDRVDHKQRRRTGHNIRRSLSRLTRVYPGALATESVIAWLTLLIASS